TGSVVDTQDRRCVVGRHHAANRGLPEERDAVAIDSRALEDGAPARSFSADQVSSQFRHCCQVIWRLQWRARHGLLRLYLQEQTMNPMDGLHIAMAAVDAYYKQRGIFQGRFGFGERPALVVIDMAYGWTDDAYAGGSARLDDAVAAIRQLLPAARSKGVP